MRRLFCLLALSLTFTAAEAGAATIDLTNFVGGWQNGLPSPHPTLAITNNPGQAVDLVTWGTVPSTSGFAFTPGASIINAPLDVPLALGSFGHANFPTSQADSVASIEYALSFSTNGSPALLSPIFTFTLQETINQAPCPFPGASECDDRVVITTPTFNALIDVGGTTYYFNLLGFSRDGGVTISDTYQTAEGAFSPATTVYGILTDQPRQAPEPGLLALLGIGFAGMAARKTRRT